MDRVVLLKMSGEAVADIEGESVVSTERLAAFSAQIAEARKVDAHLRVAVVVGGGNIVRGKMLTGVNRTKADHMGMLATVINALALQSSMDEAGVDSRLMSGVEIPKVAESYIHGRAMRHLEKNRVVIFAGGLGSPFFTTDTAAALRAAEIEAQAVLKGTHSGVDGVYTADPKLDPTATKLDEVTYMDVLNQGLGVMDPTSITFCMDNGLPIVVYDALTEGNLGRVLTGERGVGTLVR